MQNSQRLLSTIKVNPNIAFPLVECVLNLSEGRAIEKISQVVHILNEESNVHVLHQDIGFDVNRTVLTIVGALDNLLDALEKVISYSIGQFNILTHSGTHPRLGILDVIPFIPLANISFRDLERSVITWSRAMSARYKLPFYFYGGLSSNRTNPPLSFFRKGYRLHDQGLFNHIPPDLGPHQLHPELGVSCATVREFMIAINFNLEKCTYSEARKFAAFLRKRRRHSSQLDTSDVRFLAWQLEDLNVIQLSTNIYNIKAVSMLALYNYVKNEARQLGMDVSGSELIGLAPAIGIADSMTIEEAAFTMKLSSVKPFVKEIHILDLRLESILWEN